MTLSDQNRKSAASRPERAAASRRRRPAAQLFPHRPDPGRAALHHDQSDLVVHQLGGRRGAAVHSGRPAPRDLSAVPRAGLRLIIALVALTLLGFLTANLVGRTLVEFGENLLNRMPIVRPIYKTMKQIFETLFSKSGSSFGKVALVEFPAPACGRWCSSPRRRARTSRRGCRADEYVSCFLPCTPNPTTGFFFYVPRDQVIELDITVEQAMTLIMSAGMAQPNGDAQKKLAALVENGRAAHAARRRAPTTQSAVSRLPRPQQPDRLVALEQIEQMRAAPRRAARRGRDRARAISAASSRPAPSSLPWTSSRATRKPGMPLCRVPSRSPSPRSRRSSSAMRKPSSVSRMMASRALAVSPSGAR